MATFDDDLSACSALVIDGNPTSRSILISQLREFGMGTVAQAARAMDARRQLEFRGFDFVLCEQHFAAEAISGQALLDDLRRNQLLPFSTVFIMITGEATYAKVAEAAESALDGYLLKPHKASHLAERLRQARVRKVSLQAIFGAIEEEKFEQAAQLCVERFESKGLFWLYAARVGAELMLRVGRFAEAQALYKAVVEAKTLPWAKLGVARAQLDAGQMTQATSTLENLISAEPTYTDAYDVMGRAHFELGRFDKALETYKMAATMTPASISRLQNLAMMTYYAGDHTEAEKLLDRTVRLGLDSKMFDCQSLVLLAFTRLELSDRKGLQRCHDDFLRLIEKDPDNARQHRLAAIVTTLNLIQQHQFAQSVEAVRSLAKTVKNVDFDFESASNMLALMAHLANKAIQLDEVDSVVETIGLRFCNNRSLTELLAASAQLHPPYVERIRTCQTTVLEYAEVAMALSMGGNPTAAVKNLILHGKETLSARLIDNAYQVLQKHAAKIQDAEGLGIAVQELRAISGVASGKASLGEQKRQAGGLALRTGTRPPADKAPPGVKQAA
ncbi:MAG: response regulator receiver protein [Burkholderiales bacterium RIFCSPLOWO2_12_FULL_61_40]|nr:MAG: response regulator receiver protein [Burkholderiales bacterium RIFCSPLOWO2_12_FULL_61_40]